MSGALVSLHFTRWGARRSVGDFGERFYRVEYRPGGLRRWAVVSAL